MAIGESINISISDFINLKSIIWLGYICLVVWIWIDV